MFNLERMNLTGGCSNAWILGLFVILVCITYGSFALPEKDYGLCQIWQGSSYHDGSCFKVIQQELTWTEAKNKCPLEIKGGFLAELPSEKSVHFGIHLYMSTNLERIANTNIDQLEPVWLGASRLDKHSDYTWLSTGNSLRYKSTTVTVPDWPFVGVPYRRCVSLDHNGIVGESCELRKFPLCQVFVDRMCAPGYRYYDSYCYIYIDEPATFDDAKQVCKRDNDSDLVEPQTRETFNFLQDFMFEHMGKMVSTGPTVTNTTTNLGIKKHAERDFCFSVRGVGVANWMFTTNSTDLSASISCGEQLWFKARRNSSNVIAAIQVCNCSTSCEEAVITQDSSGFDWSFYCISQDTKIQQVTLQAYGHTTQHVNILHQYAFSPFTDVSFEGGFADLTGFQWKFPVTHDRSIFLGARNGLNKWLSGHVINYDVLNFVQPSSPGVNRLMLSILPYQILATKGSNDKHTFVCRQGWGSGKYNYLGVAPNDMYVHSRLYMSHVSKTTALISCHPNIGIASKSHIATVSDDDVRAVMLNELFAQDCLPTGGFNVRSLVPITVELIARTDTHWFSTQIFQTDITMQDITYVICAQETTAGQVLIMNSFIKSKISLQVPKHREVYLVEEEKRFRIYHMKVGLSEYQVLTLKFSGDISGSVVSGGSMKVFVFTIGDPTGPTRMKFDQLLPTSRLAKTYGIGIPWVTASSLKMVALYNDTIIRIPNKPDIRLNLTMDSIESDLISGGPLVLSSNNQFYLSFNFKFPRSSLECATTVVPQQYWKEVYTLVVTHFHSVRGVVTMFVVFESPDFPKLKINNAPRSLAKCAHITGSPYVACYVNLQIGHHIIKLNQPSSAKKIFGAYIVACDSKKCHCRSVGIQLNNDIISNNFKAPPLEEPEECPEPLPPKISYPYQNVTLTEDIKHEIQEKIKKELTVDKKATASFLRTKQSAKDDRASSTSLGFIGIAMISLVFALIIVPDLLSASYWLFYYIVNTTGEE